MRSVLFDIFGLNVYAYGLALGVAFIVCWHVTFHLAKDDGLPLDRVKNVVFASLVGALFFSRVAFFVAQPQRWEGVGQFLNFADGGLVAYGGYLGGLVTAWIGFRMIRANFWSFVDHAAPCLALGLCIVRLGCFMNGCDFGGTCEGSWGVAFPEGSPPWHHHREQGLISADATESLPVHPTQLYASAYGLLLFVFLLWAHRWRRRFYGQTLCLFLGIYAILRFGNEILRDDPQRGGLWIFSTSQWVSIVMFVTAIALPFYLRREQPYIAYDAKEAK